MAKNAPGDLEMEIEKDRKEIALLEERIRNLISRREEREVLLRQALERPAADERPKV